jgi:vitellogenic carboxypeptidase-like protein
MEVGIYVAILTTGKYAPAIAMAILDHNAKFESDRIPLKGISIGNQFTDPNSQILTHAAQAFYLGLVDEAQSEHLLSLAHEAIAKNLVTQGSWSLTC